MCLPLLGAAQDGLCRRVVRLLAHPQLQQPNLDVHFRRGESPRQLPRLEEDQKCDGRQKRQEPLGPGTDAARIGYRCHRSFPLPSGFERIKMFKK